MCASFTSLEACVATSVYLISNFLGCLLILTSVIIPCSSSALRDEVGTAFIKIGEEVWVKPSNARCTSRWGRGTVTDVHSQNNVSVGGMPRHVLDLRRVVDSSTDEEPEEVSEDIVLRRSQRERRRPMWMKDYVEGESSKEDEELHTNSL